MFNTICKSLLENSNCTLVLAPESMKDGHFITNGISDFLKKSELKSFKNLDKYIYISLKANYDSLEEMKYAIHSSAVYTNYFDGVIAIDSSCFLPIVKDSLFTSFLEYMSTLHATTSILLFVDDISHRNFPIFLEKLRAYLSDEIAVLQDERTYRGDNK